MQDYAWLLSKLIIIIYHHSRVISNLKKKMLLGFQDLFFWEGLTWECSFFSFQSKTTELRWIQRRQSWMQGSFVRPLPSYNPRSYLSLEINTVEKCFQRPRSVWSRWNSSFWWWKRSAWENGFSPPGKWKIPHSTTRGHSLDCRAERDKLCRPSCFWPMASHCDSLLEI